MVMNVSAYEQGESDCKSLLVELKQNWKDGDYGGNCYNEYYSLCLPIEGDDDDDDDSGYDYAPAA
ncbi:hypothetical protein TorRG33x02_324910 [Trema orientale]|uniref:Uncharacterized protein n=1 Tax=Trema orientale TaxID=63057 RepID=A0A2P5BDG3_TREOI|nr:hypothetical protein TorRG33x02_324910 [Trema orientale]